MWKLLSPSIVLQPKEKQVTENAERHDKAEEAVVAYHAGWCIIAVRRALQRKCDAESEKHLMLLERFGKDFQLEKGLKEISKVDLRSTLPTSVSKLSTLTSTDTLDCEELKIDVAGWESTAGLENEHKAKGKHVFNVCDEALPLFYA